MPGVSRDHNPEFPPKQIHQFTLLPHKPFPYPIPHLLLHIQEKVNKDLYPRVSRKLRVLYSFFSASIISATPQNAQPINTSMLFQHTLLCGFGIIVFDVFHVSWFGLDQISGDGWQDNVEWVFRECHYCQIGYREGIRADGFFWFKMVNRNCFLGLKMGMCVFLNFLGIQMRWLSLL